MFDVRNAGNGDAGRGGRFAWHAALAALAVGLLLPGAARAMPMPATNNPDYTDCFTRTNNTGETQIVHDPVDGNYWARRGTFTLNSNCLAEGYFEGTIYGLSVIVKTPFQIDSTPDVDDIDTLADFTILRDEMESLWPDFDHWTASAQADAGSGQPNVGAEGAFTSVEICVDAPSVASCLAGSPVAMTDIGGGFMIHTIDLGAINEEIYVCTGDCSEEIISFEIVSLIHSNVFSPVPMGATNPFIPELVLGFRLIEMKFVPEPGLLALWGAGLAGLALLRRRRRA